MSDHDLTEDNAPAKTLSRRGFLTATAGGGVAIAALMTGAAPQAQPVSGGSGGGSGTGSTSGVRVRRNIYALSASEEGRKTIEAYKRGVAAMMTRPLSDVTSWRFQAAIHRRDSNFPDEFAALPLELQGYLSPANMCQHSNPFFPAWHRVYLYYFERILRKACGEATFNLPYWNYTDSTAERALPEAFRTPDDEATNALYRRRRASSINAGSQLPEDAVSTTAAFRETAAASFYSSLELTPHGDVHVNVGGPGGLMSAFGTAALDPIFWLHHCNIDRLWSKWIREGHTDITTTSFLDQRYLFWDEDKNLVGLTVREILNTAAQLDYRYDDASGTEAGIVLAREAGSGVEGGQLPTELAATGSVVLGVEPVEVEAAPLVEAGGTQIFLTDPLSPTAKPVYLVLEGIRFEDSPGIAYRIFINHVKDQPYTVDSPSYATMFSPFAPPEDPAGLTRRFDISGLLNRQIASGMYTGGPLSVEIIPINAEDFDTGIELGTLPTVTIDRIKIER